MQMRPIAAGLASLGRGDDKMLVHMTPGEVAGLQTLAMKHGGSLTINPQTGLPEAGFLSSILPTIAGVGLSMTPAAPFAPFIVGGLTALSSGSLKKGLLAGLGAYGGAQFGGALQGMGEAASREAANVIAQGAGGQALGVPPEGITQALQLSPAEELSGIMGVEGTSISPGSLDVYTKAYQDANTAALARAAAQSPYEKITAGLQRIGSEPLTGLKELVGAPADKESGREKTGLGGGMSAALSTGAAAAPLLGYGMERASEAERRRFDAARQAGLGGYAPTYPQFTFRPGEYDYNTGLYSGRGFAAAQGGTVPNLGQTYPQSNIDRATYATNPQTPQAVEVLDEYGPRMNPFTMEQKMASGGVAALHEYKAGGRLLDGPGDGMSDDIPAVIKGPSPQRAALADGEFVVPADVVSHLGNGSTKAGAKRLYAMMDKVRMARVGTKKQGKQIKAERFLPA